MRQALDSPILYLANMATKGEYIQTGKYGDSCFVIYEDEVTDNMLLKSEMTICGKNVTRDKINYHVRNDIHKIDKDYPVIGDKMVCRQNNWKLSIDNNIFLINGLVGYVENV